MIFSAISAFYYFYFSYIGVQVIFFPKVLSDIGYSDIELGIIMASAPLVRFISPYIFGRRIPLTRTVFTLSLLTVIIMNLSFYIVIDHFYLIILASIIMGFGLSLSLPYVELMAMQYIKKEHYGRSRLFGSIGFIVVALILKEFMQNPYNALHFFVIISAMMLLIGFILLRLISHELGEDSKAQHSINSFSIKRHYPLWISLFLMQLAFMPFYNFFTIHETTLGISLDVTIYLWVVGVLFEIAMLYFQGPLFKRFTLIDMLIFSTAVTVVRWAIVQFFGENLYLLYFSQSLHAFSFALYHSVAVRLLFELYSEPKVAQQYFFGFSYGLGAFIGSIVAGIIYEYDPSIIFLYAALMTLIATLFLLKERSIQSATKPL